MARLIDQVSSHGPAVIAVDILYTERSNTESVFTQDQFAEIQPYLYHVLSGEEFSIQTREGAPLPSALSAVTSTDLDTPL